ncbi:glycosyltransferase family 9 protein [Paraburkholderia sp. BR10937]|uniref:glycosyltransferase family 9 protein n=1 Tax=Paraburkholderia sp. BR10937 TaxID=3236994 RepID=UPI0034D2FBEA
MSTLATIKRAALMVMSGQQFLMTETAPRNTRKVLWYYDWGTIGDSIMDLSQRFLIHADIEIDLCMPYGPIELFTGDSRFRRVFKALSDADDRYDLAIVQNITTKTLGQKVRFFPRTRFCSIMGHRRNEDFSRMQLSYERLAQIFDVTNGTGPIEPSLEVVHDETADADGFQILVAVGGNDRRRRIDDWSKLLRAVDAFWPKSYVKPRYVLLGNGEPAREAVRQIEAHLPAQRLVTVTDMPDLRAAAEVIDRCSFFLGADGGLMHIAAALGKPGVAIFSEIRPEWRLHTRSKMRPIFTDGSINEIPDAKIAGEVVRYCEEQITQNQMEAQT